MEFIVKSKKGNKIMNKLLALFQLKNKLKNEPQSQETSDKLTDIDLLIKSEREKQLLTASDTHGITISEISGGGDDDAMRTPWTLYNPNVQLRKAPPARSAEPRPPDRVGAGVSAPAHSVPHHPRRVRR